MGSGAAAGKSVILVFREAVGPPGIADTHHRAQNRRKRLMAQVEASDPETQDWSKRMQQFRLELFKERMKRVMSYLLIAADRGFVPAGWHERVADFMAHRARLGD